MDPECYIVAIYMYGSGSSMGQAHIITGPGSAELSSLLWMETLTQKLFLGERVVVSMKNGCRFDPQLYSHDNS
jgi:hypothetical protein